VLKKIFSLLSNPISRKQQMDCYFFVFFVIGILTMIFIKFKPELKTYSKAMVIYAKDNNLGKNPKEAGFFKISVVGEFKELLDAIIHLEFVNALDELFDFLHSFVKFLIITFFPEKWIVSETTWTIVGLLLIPSCLKLSKRYDQYGCIRNHKDDSKNSSHFCLKNPKPASFQ